MVPRPSAPLPRAQVGAGVGWMRELDALDAKKLMDAASVGNVHVVAALIKRSRDCILGAPSLEELFSTKHPQLGYTALHAAIDFKRPACAKLMLEHGADPDNTNSRNDQTPLHIAAAGGQVDMVAMLRDVGADQTIADAQHKRAYELVPEEQAASDPAVDRLSRESNSRPGVATTFKRTTPALGIDVGRRLAKFGRRSTRCGSR